MYCAALATILLTIRPTFSIGIPTLASRQTSTEGVGNAQLFWAGDTSLVSQFLSIAPSLSGQDLANAAASALASENDELVHKAVFDAAFSATGTGERVEADIMIANTILANQGTFQFVINGLTDLATNGASFTPDQVISSVAAINNVRCSSVLPAIDKYLEGAAVLSGNQFPNAAVRPNNCP